MCPLVLLLFKLKDFSLFNLTLFVINYNTLSYLLSFFCTRKKEGFSLSVYVRSFILHIILLALFLTLSTGFMSSLIKRGPQIILPHSRCGRTMEVYKRGIVISSNAVNECGRTMEVYKRGIVVSSNAVNECGRTMEVYKRGIVISSNAVNECGRTMEVYKRGIVISSNAVNECGRTMEVHKRGIVISSNAVNECGRTMEVYKRGIVISSNAVNECGRIMEVHKRGIVISSNAVNECLINHKTLFACLTDDATCVWNFKRLSTTTPRSFCSFL